MANTLYYSIQSAPNLKHLHANLGNKVTYYMYTLLTLKYEVKKYINNFCMLPLLF